MTKTVAEFREHYVGLHDDTLINLAITRDLVPEAKQALDAELRKRGIHDLSEYRKLHEQDMEALEQVRQEKLRAAATRSLIWTWFFYVGAGAMLSIGSYLLIFDYKHRSTNDWQTAFIAAAALFGYGWLKAKIAKFWREQILFRRPSA